MPAAATTVDAVISSMQRKGGESAGIDPEQIADLVAAVNAAVQTYLRREFTTQERTQTFVVRRRQRILALPAYPVDTGQTFELREALDRDFDSSSTLIPSTRYTLRAESGLILPDISFQGGADSVQVKWTGGMGADDDELAAAFPAVREGASLWVRELWRRGSTSSTKSQSTGRNATAAFMSLDEPPPAVTMLLRPFRSPRVA